MTAGKPIVAWKNYDGSPKWLSLVISNKIDLCNGNASLKNFFSNFSNQCLLDGVRCQRNRRSMSTSATSQSKNKLKTPICKTVLAVLYPKQSWVLRSSLWVEPADFRIRNPRSSDDTGCSLLLNFGLSNSRTKLWCDLRFCIYHNTWHTKYSCH